MKKLIILCLMAVVVVLFSSCRKIKYPKHIPPIDWENYNDVYTVYWNTVHLCGETIHLQSDTIKICGWSAEMGYFALCDDPSFAARTAPPGAHPSIFIDIDFTFPEAQAMLDTVIPNKIFLKGKLSFDYFKIKYCTRIPVITVSDINDIYFE